MKRLVACVLLAACGGPSADDDATPDAAPVATTCDPATPFGAPHAIPGLTTGNSARLSPDELTIYFADYTQSPGGIYQASRPSTSDAFGTPQLLISGDQGMVFDPTLTADQRTMYVEIFGLGGGNDHRLLYTMSRASTADPFGPPVALDSINGASTDVVGPFLTSDESELWFAEGFDEDLYHAKKVGDGFAPAVAATSLNETDRQLSPTLSADQLAIYFLRISDSLTSAKVMIAQRASVDDEFGAPIQVPEIHVADQVFAAPTWLSVDQCRMYLYARTASDADLLYVAERTP